MIHSLPSRLPFIAVVTLRTTTIRTNALIYMVMIMKNKKMMIILLTITTWTTVVDSDMMATMIRKMIGRKVMVII